MLIKIEIIRIRTRSQNISAMMVRIHRAEVILIFSLNRSKNWMENIAFMSAILNTVLGSNKNIEPDNLFTTSKHAARKGIREKNVFAMRKYTMRTFV